MLSAIIATGHSYRHCPWRDNRTLAVRPSQSSRTSESPLNSPPPTTDRDRTVSRRSEPNSRTALIGEQPNPWDQLQPQDAMSRHRGAKPPRRCELLGDQPVIPGVPFERWPGHTEPPDH